MVQAFAAANAQGLRWINREDDAGDKGLRTSKLQYLPAELGAKVRIRVRNELDHGAVLPMISYENYLSFVLGSLVCFGVVFEMPMLALLLSQFGILKAKTLVRFRKYAVLVIAIVAAIVTPPDVVSQIVVLIPMMLLYEISILICRAVGRRKAARARAEETRVADGGEENEKEPED